MADNKKPGITGTLVSVGECQMKDRKGKMRTTIVLTILGKFSDEKKDDDTLYTVKNNWDGFLETHKESPEKKLEEAKKLIGKRIQTTVWKNYHSMDWWADVTKAEE